MGSQGLPFASFLRWKGEERRGEERSGCQSVLEMAVVVVVVVVVAAADVCCHINGSEGGRCWQERS